MIWPVQLAPDIADRADVLNQAAAREPLADNDIRERDGAV
jgi:hypothetical protein